MGHSLWIHGTSLEFLGLSKLTKIESGSVLIYKNYKMCYVDQMDWTRVRRWTDSLELMSYDPIMSEKRKTNSLSSSFRFFIQIVKNPKYHQQQKTPIIKKENQNETSCQKAGRVCHTECDDAGCWGPGDEQVGFAVCNWLSVNCVIREWIWISLRFNVTVSRLPAFQTGFTVSEVVRRCSSHLRSWKQYLSILQWGVRQFLHERRSR